MANRESVIVQSKIREAIKRFDLQMDGNLPDALNERVYALLEQGAERARNNGRKTIRPYDL